MKENDTHNTDQQNAGKVGQTAAQIAKKGAKAASTAAGKAIGTATGSMLGTLIKIALPLAIAAAGAAGVYYAVKPKPFTIDNTANVIEEIRKIGEFTSTVYYEEMVLRDSYIDTVKNLLGKEKEHENEIVLIGKGRVRAGFDLTKVQESDINVHGDTLEMTLPPAEVFDIIMNPSDFTTEYESGTWSHELTKPVKARGKAELERNAYDYDILAKAEESGLKRLKALFTTFGFNTITLVANNPTQEPTPELIQEPTLEPIQEPTPEPDGE